MSESDGIDDAVRGVVRAAITAAGYAGQQIAQLLTERAQEAARLSEQRARDAQARYDAERAAARAQVAVVHRPDWWERATPESIGKVWQTVTGWREFDQDIARAGGVVEREVKQRHGVSVVELDARRRAEHETQRLAQQQARTEYETARQWMAENDPTAFRRYEDDIMASGSVADTDRLRDKLVENWRERTGAAPAEAAAERTAARVDEAAAAAVLAEPVDHPAGRREREEDAGVLYDSAERRQQLADRLDAAGVDPEAKDSRMLSDVSQGRPSRDAVALTKKAPRARPARTSARQKDHSLGR